MRDSVFNLVVLLGQAHRLLVHRTLFFDQHRILRYRTFLALRLPVSLPPIVRADKIRGQRFQCQPSPLFQNSSGKGLARILCRRKSSTTVTPYQMDEFIGLIIVRIDTCRDVLVFFFAVLGTF